MRISLRLAALASLFTTSAWAQLQVDRMLTDHMVVQRDQAVRLWGTAPSGAEVTITFAGQSDKGKADAQGFWKAELPKMEASAEGRSITIQCGEQTIELKDVVVGDVWVCSGQSNMEMGLGGCVNAQEEIKAANFPLIRRIKIKLEQSPLPRNLTNPVAPWQVCTPESAGAFSGVGYFFAREVHKKTGIPIGILESNWGGTKIEPWTASEGISSVPELQQEAEARAKAIDDYLKVQLPNAIGELEKWIGLARAELAAGRNPAPAPALPVHPGGNGWSGMYNAMISPLTLFPVKGALWYQGESNGGEGETYYHKMQALIKGWRSVWREEEFSFYFVQLASFQDATENPQGGDGWAKLREAQLKSMGISNTGMAVITDTVPYAERGDIHPRNKQDVGGRLAQWALARDYLQSEVVPSGPIYTTMEVDGARIKLNFTYTGSGLMAGKKEGLKPAEPVADGKLKRFAIAGADQKWVWADAVIEGNSVIVSSAQVKEPVAVRYAFSMNPEGANLYNKEGLPASPFRTDNW